MRGRVVVCRELLVPHAILQSLEQLLTARGVGNHPDNAAAQDLKQTADQRDLVLLGGTQRTAVFVGHVGELEETHKGHRLHRVGCQHIDTLALLVVQDADEQLSHVLHRESGRDPTCNSSELFHVAEVE